MEQRPLPMSLTANLLFLTLRVTLANGQEINSNKVRLRHVAKKHQDLLEARERMKVFQRLMPERDTDPTEFECIHRNPWRMEEQ